ncbi:MAG: peptidyl-prolyl cis-trans isomerase [Cyclobacteriaceae bacterium]
MKTSWVILFALGLVSCGLFQRKEEPPSAVLSLKPIARVYDQYLYPEDLDGLTQEGINSSDSADISERYIKSWINKKLLISQASSKIDFDEAALARKILDYRYALIVHEFKQYYINQHLDKDVTDQEIETYYREHEDNFQLKQNIMRGIFIKVPNEAPRINKISRLIRSKKTEDLEELRSYCFQFAAYHQLDEEIWHNFEDVIRNTPMVSIINQEQYLKQNKYVETSDQNYSYFMYIDEYKISDQISPLEFVRDDIINIILNKRKITLSDQLEAEIYNQANENNDFEIYRN